jgi:hypothetical protein
MGYLFEDLKEKLEKKESLQEQIMKKAFPKKDDRPFIEKGIELPSFIINGICHNNEVGYVSVVCDLGYACDACPYYRGEKK